MTKQHLISVGIMAEAEIHFTLHSDYTLHDKIINGRGHAKYQGDKITVLMDDGQNFSANDFHFSSLQGTFTVEGVTIGVNFHWENKETQTYQGDLIFIKENENIRFINQLDLEDYLCSVISSEMRSTSSIELLKAHTIISRSWLLAQIDKSKAPKKEQIPSCNETDTERIKWYDREDHTTFHVCADDHCQRYQGITRILSPLAQEAVTATKGLVLMYDDKICDARYYKCCGGITERFDSAWEPINYPYLQAVRDDDNKNIEPIDLTQEDQAKSWIMGQPSAFCNVQDQKILSQVLNDFDQSTHDFYRWQVTYSQEELSELIKKRSGIDFGQIKSMTPLSRGTSGRIYRLKIEGTKRTFIIGKELEIRKALSSSHLYSSAFIIEYGKLKDELPQNFTFHGAGWGHGVGLCQIGAAVMADKGYTYEEILQHYFKNSQLKNLK